MRRTYRTRTHGTHPDSSRCSLGTASTSRLSRVKRRKLLRRMEAERLRTAGLPVPWEEKKAKRLAEQKAKAQEKAAEEVKRSGLTSKADREALQAKRELVLEQIDELKFAMQQQLEAMLFNFQVF